MNSIFLKKSVVYLFSIFAFLFFSKEVNAATLNVNGVRSLNYTITEGRSLRVSFNKGMGMMGDIRFAASPDTLLVSFSNNGDDLFQEYPGISNLTRGEGDIIFFNWTPNLPARPEPYRIYLRGSYNLNSGGCDLDDIREINQTVSPSFCNDNCDNCDQIYFDLTINSPAPAPALSEWGVFLFGLLMITLGVVFIYNKMYRSERALA